MHRAIRESGYRTPGLTIAPVQLHRGYSFIKEGCTMQKPFKTVKEQIEILKSRNDYALNKKLEQRLKTIPCESIRTVMGLRGNWQTLSHLPKQRT